jgi:hypothetical protein
MDCVHTPIDAERPGRLRTDSSSSNEAASAIATIDPSEFFIAGHCAGTIPEPSVNGNNEILADSMLGRFERSVPSKLCNEGIGTDVRFPFDTSKSRQDAASSGDGICELFCDWAEWNAIAVEASGTVKCIRSGLSTCMQHRYMDDCFCEDEFLLLHFDVEFVQRSTWFRLMSFATMLQTRCARHGYMCRGMLHEFVHVAHRDDGRSMIQALPVQCSGLNGVCSSQ